MASVLVVNMIPASLSGETNQDSEPNLAVNPSNPTQIAASAFTPDPGGGPNAPIYVTSDGGLTWALNSILPSHLETADITLRFAESGTLYAGILRKPFFFVTRLGLLRTADYRGSALMDLLDNRGNVDQPHVQAATVAATGQDRVYVGMNDFTAAGGETATIEQALDAANAPIVPASPTGFTLNRIESRATKGQDGPQIRAAIHPDGTLYGIYYGWRAWTQINDSDGDAIADVVVVRDDGWGTAATPFANLVDPIDSLAGIRIATGIKLPWRNSPAMGQERIGGDVSIASDPRDSSVVYALWNDRVGTTDYSMHVTCSFDRGETWSGAVLSVTDAKNGSLAINGRGDVGLLYQQLVGAVGSQRWVTHFRRTTDQFATSTDVVLSDTQGDDPVSQFLPYLGDYCHLMAIGRDFYGIFSASNVPDAANFPAGVTYQRNADWAAHHLLGTDGVTVVGSSIDPFFFKVTDVDANAEVYVRDWTDSPSVHDTGSQPSSRPVFWTTSDVWNRRTAAPGAFNPQDRPQNEDPQMISLGTNHAFVRVSRNATGTTQDVGAHFLYAEFGTGSNFQDAGTTPDATVHLGIAQPMGTLTSGYEWSLPTTSSTHLCLAVEIATPDDPVIPPSLRGRAPGAVLTNASIVADNNKAQRNMGVYTTATGNADHRFYAIVHNALLDRRDVVLGYEIPKISPGSLGRLRLGEVGQEGVEPETSGTITFAGLEPGENRWVYLALPAATARPVSVLFSELVNGRAINGFTIEIRRSEPNVAAREALELIANTLQRSTDAGISEEGRLLARTLARILQQPTRRRDYTAVATDNRQRIADAAGALAEVVDHDGAFESRGAIDRLRAARRASQVAALGALAHRLDAAVTRSIKRDGDQADILQMMAWQAHLLTGLQAQSERDWHSLVASTRAFIEDFEARRVDTSEYGRAISRQLKQLDELVTDLTGDAARRLALEAMRQRLEAPALLEGAHRAFLLALSKSAA